MIVGVFAFIGALTVATLAGLLAGMAVESALPDDPERAAAIQRAVMIGVALAVLLAAWALA